MVFLGKIYVRYKIDTPKSLYKPLDEINGTFWIENRGEKDKKLKSIELRLIEFFYKLTHPGKHAVWDIRMNTLKKYPIDKGKTIQSNETIQYGFKIYDFNPSGGHEGVVRFKKSFGAKKRFFNIWYFKNKGYKLLHRISSVYDSMIVGKK